MSLNKRWNREEVISQFSQSDNELVKIATQYPSTKITDPEICHYCELYDFHFNKLKNKKLKILEIGVKDGDSLLIWKEYFKNSLIFGLEYNPEPLKDYSHDKIEVFIGDQSDVEVLKHITESAGPFDIIIDDASHIMTHQQISFNYLFPQALKDTGTYVIEDLGTSYWKDWGGGLLEPGATIEFLKSLIDGVNYRFHKGNRKQYVGIPSADKVDSTYLDEHITGLSFYKGICFIQKGTNPKETL